MKAHRAVLLYGSYARGDFVDSSDVDILVIGDGYYDSHEVERFAPRHCHGPIHVSHYTWDESLSMAAYGSLLLHHIRDEAIVLHCDGLGEQLLGQLLGSLIPYKLATRDVAAFRCAITDSNSGLEIGISPMFELAVLGGIARHASVLACYLGGQPMYGRSSISLATRMLEMTWAEPDLALAHRFRLFVVGQCALPARPSKRAALRVSETLAGFLDRLQNLAYANAA